MDFDIPAELDAYLNELDRFIEDEIKPLENENDNIRFFDHRREDARTCLLYTSPSPRDGLLSRMPSSA